jgi:serine/threonine protein kinase
MEVLERCLKQTETLGGSFIHVNARLLDEEPRCVVMDFIDAPTLAKVLQREGPLAPARAAAILENLAKALAEMHQHDAGELMYGSLRPSEIFLLGEQEVRLSAIDFSNELLRCERLRGNIFMTHDLPTYMTPEQYFGWPMNAKTDQYFLALLGLELLSGSPPNRVRNPVDLEERRKFFDNPDAWIGEWRRECPGLAEVLLRMLNKNPEARFPSMKDVIGLIGKPRINWIVVDKLKEHYTDCRKQGLEVFYRSFYEELFQISPDVHMHFDSISWQRQYEMLDFAIELLLDFDISRPQIRLNEMLKRHGHLPLTEDHIAKFFEAFIATLQRFVLPGNLASANLIDMWRVAIDPGMRYMMEQISRVSRRNDVF